MMTEYDWGQKDIAFEKWDSKIRISQYFLNHAQKYIDPYDARKDIKFQMRNKKKSSQAEY